MEGTVPPPEGRARRSVPLQFRWSGHALAEDGACFCLESRIRAAADALQTGFPAGPEAPQALSQNQQHAAGKTG
jgi:hypothetical protein